MFNLLKLPVELVEQIIDVVHPRDIESLAHCGNELIKTLMEKTLLRHLKLKETYSYLTICDWKTISTSEERHFGIKSSAIVFGRRQSRFSIIKELLENPDLTCYPISLVVGSLKHPMVELGAQWSDLYPKTNAVSLFKQR